MLFRSAKPNIRKETERTQPKYETEGKFECLMVEISTYFEMIRVSYDKVGLYTYSLILL